jgi:hypothetical protein
VLLLGEMPLIREWLSALIFRGEFTVRRNEIQAKVSYSHVALRLTSSA